MLVATLGAALAVSVPRAAHAKGPARACGVSAIPLVVGNEWTYQATTLPEQVPPTAEDARKNPRQVQKLVIQVVSVETQNGVTTVTLSEDADGHKVNTTITCAKDKFDVSPDSFFFAGEPGGVYGIDLTSSEHKGGTTLKLARGRLQGPDWRDDVAATWKEVPSKGSEPHAWSGKLEMERHFTITGKDNISSTGGIWQGAQRVQLVTTGRVTLDPPDANPLEFQAKLENTLWFVDGIGVVQVHNAYNHSYQLASMKLAK